MIVQRLTRRVEIEAGGKLWPLLFTHRVLMEIEERSGLDIMAGGLNLNVPSAKVLRAAVFVLLQAAGASFSEVEIGNMLRGRLSELRIALLDAWNAAKPEPVKETSDNQAASLTWIEAWAIARQDLKLSDEEWLNMTPRMVQELDRRRLEGIRQQEFLLSRIAANLVYF